MALGLGEALEVKKKLVLMFKEVTVCPNLGATVCIAVMGCWQPFSQGLWNQHLNGVHLFIHLTKHL